MAKGLHTDEDCKLMPMCYNHDSTIKPKRYPHESKIMSKIMVSNQDRELLSRSRSLCKSVPLQCGSPHAAVSSPFIEGKRMLRAWRADLPLLLPEAAS